MDFFDGWLLRNWIEFALDLVVAWVVATSTTRLALLPTNAWVRGFALGSSICIGYMGAAVGADLIGRLFLLRYQPELMDAFLCYAPTFYELLFGTCLAAAGVEYWRSRRRRAATERCDPAPRRTLRWVQPVFAAVLLLALAGATIVQHERLLLQGPRAECPPGVQFSAPCFEPIEAADFRFPGVAGEFGFGDPELHAVATRLPVAPPVIMDPKPVGSMWRLDGFRFREKGTCVVDAEFAADGSVRRVEWRAPADAPTEVRQAVISDLRAAETVPAILDGRPIDATFTVRIGACPLLPTSPVSAQP